METRFHEFGPRVSKFNGPMGPRSSRGPGSRSSDQRSEIVRADRAGVKWDTYYGGMIRLPFHSVGAPATIKSCRTRDVRKSPDVLRVAATCRRTLATSGDFTGERRCSGNVISDFVISARWTPPRVTVADSSALTLTLREEEESRTRQCCKS